MTYVPRSSLLAAGAFALLLLTLLGGCGRTSLGESDTGGFGGNIIINTGSSASTGGAGGTSSCGNKVCDPSESCTTCPIDCGLCPTCGNKVCDSGETCASCPQDCGKCSTCGDGKCEPPEDCLTCAPDCGACPSCGDGVCTAPNENCFTCPNDCGMCANCPDGSCNDNKTCASCPADCGVCSVCGNGKCEAPYETCTNCPADCGGCTTPPTNCIETVMCAIQCFQTTPAMLLSCASECDAQACANGKSLADLVVDCAATQCLGKANVLNCVMAMCANQIAACIDSNCQ